MAGSGRQTRDCGDTEYNGVKPLRDESGPCRLVSWRAMGKSGSRVAYSHLIKSETSYHESASAHKGCQPHLLGKDGKPVHKRAISRGVSRRSSIMSASFRFAKCLKCCTKAPGVSSSRRHFSTTCAVALPRRKSFFSSPEPAPEEEIPSASTSAATAAQAESRQEPWFVDPGFQRPLASAKPAAPPPPHIPRHFLALYEYLVTSPFFDPDSVVFVDARAVNGDGALWEWVVVATLRPGRERSIRGAADGVKDIVSWCSWTRPRGKGPIAQNVYI
jgi:hypothetical protein